MSFRSFNSLVLPLAESVSSKIEDSQQFASVCEAIGLEAAVQVWWRGPRCRDRTAASTQAKRVGGAREDVWLRRVVAGGANGAARAKLSRSGIPDRVIDGGLRLAKLLEADAVLKDEWRLSKENIRFNQAKFIGSAIEHAFGVFDIQMEPFSAKEDAAVPPPGLCVSPRSGIESSSPWIQSEGPFANPYRAELAAGHGNDDGRFLSSPRGVRGIAPGGSSPSSLSKCATKNQSARPEVLRSASAFTPMPFEDATHPMTPLAQSLTPKAPTSPALGDRRKTSIRELRSRDRGPPIEFDRKHASSAEPSPNCRRTLANDSSVATPRNVDLPTLRSPSLARRPSHLEATLQRGGFDGKDCEEDPAWNKSARANSVDKVVEQLVGSCLHSPWSSEMSIRNIRSSIAASDMEGARRPDHPRSRAATSDSDFTKDQGNPRSRTATLDSVTVKQLDTPRLSRAAMFDTEARKSPDRPRSRVTTVDMDVVKWPANTRSRTGTADMDDAKGTSYRRSTSEVSEKDVAKRRESYSSEIEPSKEEAGRRTLVSSRSKSNPRKKTSGFDNWMKKVQKEEKVIAEAAAQAAAQEDTSAKGSVSKPKKPGVWTKRACRDMAEIRRIFEEFDLDGKGMIIPAEWPPLLAKLTKQPKAAMKIEEVWKVWDEIDVDGSGDISLEEFTDWYCKNLDISAIMDFTEEPVDINEHESRVRNVSKKLNVDIIEVDKIWKEFSQLDADSNCELDKDEFEVLIHQKVAPKGEKLAQQTVNMFWRDVDQVGRGAVSFEEFASWYVKFFLGVTSPMEQFYRVTSGNHRTAL